MFLYRSDDGRLLLNSKKMDKLEDHVCDGD